MCVFHIRQYMEGFMIRGVIYYPPRVRPDIDVGPRGNSRSALSVHGNYKTHLKGDKVAFCTQVQETNVITLKRVYEHTLPGTKKITLDPKKSYHTPLTRSYVCAD